ncbi:MAG: TRAP transporter substrate-binding protein DctP [Deltaproteobacteria bacterium]|nr:TRAP transporter substrate-binding protein DctP [Deltaproteobacteria bacterium]
MRVAVAVSLLLLLGGRAEADKQIRLRLGTLAIDGSRYMTDILALGREIAARTDGAVHLDWVTGGRLGDETAMAELVQRGKLDGGGFSEVGLAALAPEMAVWRYPGLFQDYGEVDRATAALDATVRGWFDRRDVVFAMWADLGFAHVFARRPFATLREALVRATPWLSRPLDGKLTAEIAGGTAQAWAMPPLYMLAIGATQGHAKQMTALRYRYVVGGLVFARAAWARLTAEQQAAVAAVCRAWQPRLRDGWRRETERGLGTLARAGVATHVSPPAELAAFVEASARSRATHAASLGLDKATEAIASAARAP